MVGIPIMPFSLVFAELLSHSLYYAECKGTRKAEHKVKSDHANASLAPQGLNTNYVKLDAKIWLKMRRYEMETYRMRCLMNFNNSAMTE